MAGLPGDGTSGENGGEGRRPSGAGEPPLSRRAAREAGWDAVPESDPDRGRRRVAVRLSVAAVLLVLWSATTFVDSGNVLIASLAALSPVVSVLALPVVAIGVAGRHWAPSVLAVAAAVLPWGLVAGYAIAGPGQTAAGVGTSLRVMSVDGANGRASARQITTAALAYGADLVVVTGLTSELAHELTVDGLTEQATPQWVQVPTGPGGTTGDGVGLWSRPTLDGLIALTGFSRPGVRGTIEADGRPIGLTAVQFDGEPLGGGSGWHADLARLDRANPDTPGFIVGDLGATPWQPAFRRLTADGWRDATDVAGRGLRPTWPSWSPFPIAPLDHVLVSRGIGVSGASTANIAGSDHRALFVTLSLPPAAGG